MNSPSPWPRQPCWRVRCCIPCCSPGREAAHRCSSTAHSLLLLSLLECRPALLLPLPTEGSYPLPTPTRLAAPRQSFPASSALPARSHRLCGAGDSCGACSLAHRRLPKLAPAGPAARSPGGSCWFGHSLKWHGRWSLRPPSPAAAPADAAATGTTSVADAQPPAALPTSAAPAGVAGARRHGPVYAPTGVRNRALQPARLWHAFLPVVLSKEMPPAENNPNLASAPPPLVEGGGRRRRGSWPAQAGRPAAGRTNALCCAC